MRFENTWNGRRKRLSEGILAMTRDSISRKVSKPVGKAQSLGNANVGKLRLANGESSDEEEIEAPIDDEEALSEALDRYKDGLGLKIRRTEIPVKPFPAGMERVTTPEEEEEDNRVELAIVTEGILP
jgi:hypothetical protein